jgi:hypothetical protein
LNDSHPTGQVPGTCPKIHLKMSIGGAMVNHVRVTLENGPKGKNGDYHSQGVSAGKVAKWPIRYLIRHTPFHTMDHAWEMEDQDLTAKQA